MNYYRGGACPPTRSAVQALAPLRREASGTGPFFFRVVVGSDQAVLIPRKIKVSGRERSPGREGVRSRKSL